MTQALGKALLAVSLLSDGTVRVLPLALKEAVMHHAQAQQKSKDKKHNHKEDPEESVRRLLWLGFSRRIYVALHGGTILFGTSTKLNRENRPWPIWRAGGSYPEPASASATGVESETD